jgi:hypothetical protein
MKMGAQPTVTTHNLLVKEGVLTTKKIAVKMPKVVIKEKEAPVAEAVSAAETVVEAEAVETKEEAAA